jgi:hypothetical protein
MGREVGPKNSTDRDRCSTVLLSRNGFQDYRNKTRSEQARGRQREGRQVGKGQETGKQTGRQGLDNRRVVRQARGQQQEGSQADEEQETGKQTGRQGLDDRRVVRQARGLKQAGSALKNSSGVAGKLCEYERRSGRD